MLRADRAQTSSKMRDRRKARLLTVCAASFALFACGDRTGTDGSEQDFANRVGAGQTTSGAPAGSVATTAVAGPPPTGADVRALEQLGDISGLDLGQRAAGCTFSANGQELMTAAAPSDRALPGKAAVRIGGKLLLLDAPPGGVDALKAGTVYSGEGFEVRTQRTAADAGRVTITGADGANRVIEGRWICG